MLKWQENFLAGESVKDPEKIQKSFYGICPKIIGMAKGKEEALEMVRSLIDEMYRETGTFATAEYIENR